MDADAYEWLKKLGRTSLQDYENADSTNSEDYYEYWMDCRAIHGAIEEIERLRKLCGEAADNIICYVSGENHRTLSQAGKESCCERCDLRERLRQAYGYRPRGTSDESK